ncbi:hypothetical protein KI387_035867, partial [Taxus chinensis]
CVVEEVQGPSQARTRKERFISGHARPGSPYVYGLAGADIDVEFPEPVPVVGISRSARGYCFISVLETMQTFSAVDGLTEQAIVAKLRASSCHSLFLHSSLRTNSSGLRFIAWKGQPPASLVISANSLVLSFMPEIRGSMKLKKLSNNLSSRYVPCRACVRVQYVPGTWYGYDTPCVRPWYVQ